MRKKDYMKMERYALKYNGMLIRLCLNEEVPFRITMIRRRNSKKRIFTKFYFDVCDKRGNIRTEILTANNCNYLWILTAASADFPDCAFEDKSTSEFKRVQQPTEEAID